MANTNKLKVVLISSEGAIMLFLKELSAANRSLVYEIGDLDKEQANSYLLGKNMRQDTAKKVVSCVGGRLVYLQSCLKLPNLNFNDDHVCEEIKAALFLRKLSAQRDAISMMKPESSTIIKSLAECDSMSTYDVIDGAHNKQKMNKVIRAMIDSNVLRYNKAGKIKWHGKVQQDGLAITDGGSENGKVE